MFIFLSVLINNFICTTMSRFCLCNSHYPFLWPACVCQWERNFLFGAEPLVWHMGLDQKPQSLAPLHLIILNIQQTTSDVTFNYTSLAANPTDFSQPFWWKFSQFCNSFQLWFLQRMFSLTNGALGVIFGCHFKLLGTLATILGNDVMSILPLTNKGREVLVTKSVDSVTGCYEWLFLTHPYYHSQIRGEN